MSSPAPVGPEAPPAEGQHIDLTEDLAQQLEDIISTYQAEIPAEPEDAEEVTAVKEADTRKDQKLEKKMLKNLGVLFFFLFFFSFSECFIDFSRGGFSFSSVSRSPSCTETDRCVSGAVMRVSASIRNRRAGKIVFPRAVYSWLQLTHTGRQTSCKHRWLAALKRSSNPT